MLSHAAIEESLEDAYGHEGNCAAKRVLERYKRQRRLDEAALNWANDLDTKDRKAA